MRLTALHIGIIVALMAVVVLTYAALTVDYYSWELKFSLWLQGFSLGRADFSPGVAVLGGCEGSIRGGAAGDVRRAVAPALAIGGHIRELWFPCRTC